MFRVKVGLEFGLRFVLQSFNYIKFASYSAVPFVVVLTLNVAVVYRTLRLAPKTIIIINDDNDDNDDNDNSINNSNVIIIIVQGLMWPN